MYQKQLIDSKIIQLGTDEETASILFQFPLGLKWYFPQKKLMNWNDHFNCLKNDEISERIILGLVNRHAVSMGDAVNAHDWTPLLGLLGYFGFGSALHI